MKNISLGEKLNSEIILKFELRKVKKDDLVVFCRLFYTMLNAGINITQSLEVICMNTGNSKLRKGLKEINNDIYKGLNLSDSMGNQDKIFPSFFVEMIRAGEISGNLEEIIERLGDYYEGQNKIENKLKSSLVYPITLMVLSIVLVIFMLSFVFPLFYELLNSREAILPLSTRILMHISSIINDHWETGFLLLIASFLGIKAYLKTKKGLYFKDNLKLKTPFINRIYKRIIAANFTKTLSLLLSSGIPLIKSLEISNRVINNTVIQSKFQTEILNIERGKDLASAIKSLGIFPSVIDSMVKIGEESGALDQMLLKTSKYYDEEVGTSIEQFSKLIEPILMIFIGLIVGFIVISIVLPVFDIMYTF